jgi:hypothetical protein
MSQRTVEFLIGRLLTDEELRLRFVLDPLDTLAAWLNAGFELTASEIDGLIQTDTTVWSRAAEHSHQRVRRYPLCGG